MNEANRLIAELLGCQWWKRTYKDGSYCFVLIDYIPEPDPTSKDILASAWERVEKAAVNPSFVSGSVPDYCGNDADALEGIKALAAKSRRYIDIVVYGHDKAVAVEMETVLGELSVKGSGDTLAAAFENAMVEKVCQADPATIKIFCMKPGNSRNCKDCEHCLPRIRPAVEAAVKGVK